MGVRVVAGELLQLTACDARPIDVGEFGGGRHGLAAVEPPDLDRGPRRVDRRGGEVVEEDGGRPREQVDVAEDPADAELVLIFQVAAVAPLEYKDGQAVGARLDDLGDVELGGGVRDLAVADVLAVEPHVEAGVDAFEGEMRARGVFTGRVLELVDVRAARIVLRDERRIEREGVADVRVLVVVVALVLPRARHRHTIETARGEVALVEVVPKLVDALEVPERPLTVQQLQTIGGVTSLRTGVERRGTRDVVGTCRERVLVQNGQVLVVPGHDHRWISSRPAVVHM